LGIPTSGHSYYTKLFRENSVGTLSG